MEQIKSAWKPTSRFARLRRSIRGAADGEGIGFGVAVIGGIVAVATLLAVIFVPAATFTTLDAEEGAAVGIAMLVIGVAVREASM